MQVYDVVVAGGGPAGATAAVILARAGVRVAVVDRARFPRHKLCGDTINPGALDVLQRLGIEAAAGDFPTAGMIVTGEGLRIAGRYPIGITGRAVLRQHFDHALLVAAAQAGARVEENVLVRATTTDGTAIDGVTVVTGSGREHRIGARVVIAADGRHSRLARSLHLSRYPRSPRRWAVGTHFTDVAGLTAYGEMHIRRRKYIGVAPLPAGLTNVCVVTGDPQALRDPGKLLAATLREEPMLQERFANARPTAPPAVLGPLAVECCGAGLPGLLLAGDAAGFVDPMTGDGLRFAIGGGELAAREALRALEHGFRDAHRHLARARTREFGTKWRFNRVLRGMTGSPAAIRLAAVAASIFPVCVEHAIRYAGDVRVHGPRPGLSSVGFAPDTAGAREDMNDRAEAPLGRVAATLEERRR